MEFPVDVLEATSHGELERSAHSYMNELLYTDPDHAHYFTLPSGRKVQISLSSVGFVPLYGASIQHKVLALFTPQDQLTAVALFLANQWYSVEDILKTANSRKDGLVKVRSVGERIVLYILNRIVYRTKEMGSGEMPFLCHSENDYAKVLWKNGQAVGFYSVKPKGSIYNNSLGQCYVLPVMDSIFVRKTHRGKGYGLQMLEDFVDSFNEDELGLKYPLSPAMANVCRHYLDRYPADVDLFWEVEGVGGPYQRTKVAYKLSSRPLNDAHKGGPGEDDGRNGNTVEESEETRLNITEEVVINKYHKVTEEIDTPISMHTRSSEHRQRKRIRDEEEAKGLEMAEEEKEFVPSDVVVAESVPEAPIETLALEVNGNQAEEKERVKEGAEEKNESANQNGTGGEEEEEMEVEEEAEEHKAPVQKGVDSASGQQEVTLVAKDNQDMEVDPIAHLQQKEEIAPAPEVERVAKNEQKLVGTQAAPADKKQEIAPAVKEEQEIAPAAEKEQNVAPAAEEEQEVAPVPEEKQEGAPANEEEVVDPVSEEEQEGAPASEEEQEGAPASEEEQEGAPASEEEQEGSPASEEEQEGSPASEEEQEGSPASEEEQEGAPAAEEEQEGVPAAEEEQEGVPATEEKQDETAVAVQDQEGAPSVEEEQEVAPEIEKNVDPAAEEEQEVILAAKEELEVDHETEDDEVASEVEKHEVDPPAEETSSSLASDAEGEKGQEEAMDVVNEGEVPDISELSSEEYEWQPAEEKENSTLMVEAVQKEEEVDEERGEKNANEASDFSRVPRGARTKAVPPTSKRTSKRLSRVAVEDDEEQQGVVEQDKGMSTEEEKVTTEEEAEHSSEEEEQVHDPPVIDKRVLRGKTKVIQTKQRTRSKRRGKI